MKRRAPHAAARRAARFSFAAARRAASSTLTGALRAAVFVLAAAGTNAAHAAGGTPQQMASQALRGAAADFTDRLIVKYRNDAALATPSADARLLGTQQAASRLGYRLQTLRATALPHTHVLRTDRKLSLADMRQLAADLAANDPNVEYAEPDRLMRIQLTPNDTRYAEQWHYYEATAGLNLPPAWDKATGSGIVVAVIDTGYRPHADLAANLLPGYDMITDTFVSNDGNGRDSDASDPGDAVLAGECGGGQPTQDESSSWHGTHVAGTIAAVTNNGTGVAGVAFGAKVVPVRVLGKCGGYTSDIADGIVWASGGSVPGVPANANPARVINMSLGGGGSCDTTTQNAINAARGRNTVVVVAAGNSNDNAANYSPASCSGVITVAAVNRSGGRAYYSNYGSIVAVAAPGGDMRSSASNGILSTLNTGATSPGSDTYAFYQGTSMATPHVAGVAALMLSKNPALTPDEVATRLKQTARAFPASCSGCGAGIVNASGAVDAATGRGGGSTIAEVEPNNSRGAPQTVASPATVNGTMGSSTDTDWYALSLGPGKTLTATLTPNPSSDYDLYVYDSAGTLIARSERGTGQVDSASVTNSGSATLTRYVRVVYYSGSTGTAGNYSLQLGF